MALIGYGLAGSVFHAPLIAATEGLALDTIVTSNPERQEQARAEFGDGVSFAATPEELWARADELDLIVIASPNKTHVPLATAALKAGLPVVVDKPSPVRRRRPASWPRWPKSAACSSPSSRTAAGTTTS